MTTRCALASSILLATIGIAGAVLLAATPSIAMTYFLQQDLGVQGFQHYCQYSNGQTYSVKSTSLCPLSLEDTAHGMGRGMGFKQGEYVDGLTKVCLYSVLGEQKAIRVNPYELCPLTYQF